MIYVCGPMAGIEEYNFPAFKKVTKALRESGEQVICPTELNHPDEGKTWEQCLRIDIEKLVTCDAIAYLPGWEHSKGATLEMTIAQSLLLEFIEVRWVEPHVTLRRDYPPPEGQIARKFFMKHYDRVLQQLLDGAGRR